MAARKKLTGNERRYRSIMAKLNFGHPLTSDDRAFIRSHPEFDWGPNSGSDLPNRRKTVGERRQQALQSETKVLAVPSRTEVARRLGLSRFDKRLPPEEMIIPGVSFSVPVPRGIGSAGPLAPFFFP